MFRGVEGSLHTTSTDVYAHLYLGLMSHTQEASEASWILCVLLYVGEIFRRRLDFHFRITQKQSLLTPTVGSGRVGDKSPRPPMLIKHPYRLPLKFNPDSCSTGEILFLQIVRKRQTIHRKSFSLFFWGKKPKN